MESLFLAIAKLSAQSPTSLLSRSRSGKMQTYLNYGPKNKQNHYHSNYSSLLLLLLLLTFSTEQGCLNDFTDLNKPARGLARGYIGPCVKASKIIKRIKLAVRIPYDVFMKPTPGHLRKERNHILRPVLLSL